MATAADLGLITPTGTDYISDGDDAITTNANTIASWITDLDERANLPARAAQDGEDLNAAMDPQIIRQTSSSSLVNAPQWDLTYSSSIAALFLVVNAPGNAFAAQIAFRYGATPEMAWRMSRNTSGVWQDWQMVRAQDAEIDDAAPRHIDLRSRARQRRGGPVGTAGLPVVALRFDHHTGPWETKVLPVLERLGLPWAQVINPSSVGTGDDTMPYADLEAAAIRSGGEVWNHGGNHGDAAYPAEAVREIPDALRTLVAALPRLAVEGWAPPGLAAGEYMGAAPFKTTEQNTATYTGQLIMRNHAFVAGYAPGTYRTLDPAIEAIGAGHMTIDASYPAQIGRALDALGSDGMALMLHANYLDQTGYMTTADLTAALEDIAARRDAGELLVLSYSGLWLADSRSSMRDDLILPAQTAETSGAWSAEWDVYRREDRLGSIREAGADVLASAGATVTFTLTYSETAETISHTRTVPASASWQRVIAPFTLPADLTAGTATLTIDTGTAQQRAQSLAAI